MFNECKQLEQVNFTLIQTEIVSSMSFMFSSYSNLKEIYLSSFKMKKNCSGHEEMFRYCILKTNFS